MSVVTMWSGRVLLAAGALAAIAGAFTGVGVVVLGAGLLALGGVLAVVGAHRTRRPQRHVEVDAGRGEVVLRPEGARHPIAALGELSVIDWQFERTDNNGVARLVKRAAVRAPAIDAELFLTETREECTAWLGRFEAAVAGRPAPTDVARTPVDRALEAPPAALLGGWAVATAVTLGALWWLWGAASPSLPAIVGVLALVLAAVWGWVGVGRRGVGALVGFVGAGVLMARPFARPVERVIDGVAHPLSLFAEAHLGLLIGGVALALATLAASRRPGARTAS